MGSPLVSFAAFIPPLLGFAVNSEETGSLCPEGLADPASLFCIDALMASMEAEKGKSPTDFVLLFQFFSFIKVTENFFVSFLVKFIVFQIYNKTCNHCNQRNCKHGNFKHKNAA